MHVPLCTMHALRRGHAWQPVFPACSKLEAMAINLVKQACGNDILASVYEDGAILFLVSNLLTC